MTGNDLILTLVAQVHGDDGPNVYADEFDRRAYIEAPQRLCEPHPDVARVPIGRRHRLGFVFVQGEFTRHVAAAGTASMGPSSKATPPASTAANDSVCTFSPSAPSLTSIPLAFQKRVTGFTKPS